MADQASYVHAASTIPLLNDTIGVSLNRAANRWPDREAVVVYDQDIRLTFAELHEETSRLAAGFIALDLPPGARIGIWSPNRIEWVLTQYAVAKAGLILVNINPAYRLAELEFALNKVECRALVTADRFKTTDYIGMLRALAPELNHCDPGALRAERLPHLTTLIHMASTEEPGFYAFDIVRTLGGPAEYARLNELAALLQPADPANILFTSGTTGLPKAATLTHRSTLNNAFFVGLMMGVIEGDRFCRPLPLYHVGGMVLGSVLGIVHGVTVIYLGEAFDPQVALETLQNERCTLFVGVPTMFVAILNHPAFTQYDLTNLRLGFIVGAPCPAELMRRIISKMPIRDVMIGYGMTEASGGVSQTSPGDTLERRVETVGRAHPYTEIKIVDPEGRMVPRGTQGQICVRGYMVMQGYWNDEPATREAINEASWLHSGDLGTMDVNGYIAITGRSKDMIIRGGENIYPREIEEFLFRHPAIADVHGFGVPDEHFGEELCVWIKLRNGTAVSEEDIRAFCRGQITHFKIPRYIRFVDAFPMTVTGKVQKFIMQETMVSELASVAILLPNKEGRVGSPQR
jgi:fatty-acyl-CoA synthase